MALLRHVSFLLSAILYVIATVSFQPSDIPFKFPVTVADGFAASVVFSNLTVPRGITIDDHGAVLVVERGLGVSVLTEVQKLKNIGWERKILIPNPNFTQGIQVDGNRLYVSTAGEVLLFDYDGKRKIIRGEPTIVIDDIPSDGELTTHALQLERHAKYTNLLVAAGPLTNIDSTARDPSSGRSQIRQFTFKPHVIPSVQSFLAGELLGYGIRNPAGFAFAPGSHLKALYVVENGASVDNVTGLTPTFVNDNPADELELVLLNGSPKSYGFPDCTTLWNPLADPQGVPQFVNLSRGAQFSLQLEPDRDDVWCKNKLNNAPPAASFQAHSVPLDIKFYRPDSLEPSAQGFPTSLVGDAFVSFHGSFDRDPPTGYSVIHLPFSQSGPSAGVVNILIQPQDLMTCTTPSRCIRPVGLAFDAQGRLFVSSDATGEIFNLQSAS